ncbi:hypothetical protein FHS61_003173 [Altererythrobacter atlanticus]|uniref:hypothetical protein n=1 Tax=Croceibacterium atlanticum TaxID=1267766 RepID=UPI0012E2ED8C|nr:hypothetical protein [Croceibacterium atlanticum]MBB5734123.1 hypothetical protein [Croceibacterium atlanticum]
MIFKIVDTAGGVATVYRRTEAGSDRLYEEVTAEALRSARGGALVGIDCGNVERALHGRINLANTGADLTGERPGNAAFAEMLAAANNIKGEAWAPGGSIRLTGSEDFLLATDADMSRLTVIVDNWTGAFVLADDEGDPKEHLPGDDVVERLTDGDLQAGNRVLSGWADLPETNDKLVVLETSRPMYSYRGKLQTEVVINITSREGFLKYPLKYTIDKASIMKITLRPLASRRKHVVLPTFDIRKAGPRATDKRGIQIPYILNRMTRADIERGHFLMATGELPDNPDLMRNEYAALSVISSPSVPWVGRHDGSGRRESLYALSNQRTCGLTIKSAIAIGDGWGASGGNDNCDLTFVDCDLSRYDSHRPTQYRMRLVRCTIGYWGVLASMMGDLELLDCTVEQATPLRLKREASVISSRVDTGGFCDGGLLVRNLTVRTYPVGDDEEADTIHFMRQVARGSDNPKPDGSPVDYTWFKWIDIDGLRVEGPGFLRFEPTRFQGGPRGDDPARLTLPERISIRNVIGHVQYQYDFTGRSFNAALADDPFDIYIEHTGANHDRIFFQEDERGDIAVNVSLSGCNSNASSPAFADTLGLIRTNAPGRYLLTGGSFSRINAYGDGANGGWPKGTVFLTAYAPVVNDRAAVSGENPIVNLTPRHNGWAELHQPQIHLASVARYAADGTTREARCAGLLNARLVDPVFLQHPDDGGGSFALIPANLAGNEFTLTNGNMREGQQLQLAFGAAGHGDFPLPAPGGKTSLAGIDDSGHGQFLVLERVEDDRLRVLSGRDVKGILLASA